MQKPAVAAQATEEPEAPARGGFGAVVVPADALFAPPASFDPFGAPMTRDLVLLVLESKLVQAT